MWPANNKFSFSFHLHSKRHISTSFTFENLRRRLHRFDKLVNSSDEGACYNKCIWLFCGVEIKPLDNQNHIILLTLSHEMWRGLAQLKNMIDWCLVDQQKRTKSSLLLVSAVVVASMYQIPKKRWNHLIILNNRFFSNGGIIWNGFVSIFRLTLKW